MLAYLSHRPVDIRFYPSKYIATTNESPLHLLHYNIELLTNNYTRNQKIYRNSVGNFVSVVYMMNSK